jgi:hypothetical protein
VGWLVVVAIVTIVIFAAIKKRNARQQTVSDQGSPYPPHIAKWMAMLKDPDMIFVSDFGFRAAQDASYAGVDLNRTVEFIKAYIRLVPESDEFQKNYMATAALMGFIMVFMAKPGLFFKNFGLVDADYFMTQFDIELQNQSLVNGEVDYKQLYARYREYLDMIKDYPAMEAKHYQMPVEQTNWYKVVEILRDRAEG